MFSKEHRQQCCDEKDIDEWALELTEEQTNKASPLPFRQGIGAIVAESSSGFLR